MPTSAGDSYSKMDNQEETRKGSHFNILHFRTGNDTYTAPVF
jgi:hypothetical protein